MIAMHSVCCCSLPVWRSFLKKGTPWPIFAPPWPKNNNTCKGPWVLHPYQVSSKSIKRFWRSWKCESLRTTDNGRCAMTIAHLSLRLINMKSCALWSSNLPSVMTDQIYHQDQIYHRAAKRRGDKFDRSMTRGKVLDNNTQLFNSISILMMIQGIPKTQHNQSSERRFSKKKNQIQPVTGWMGKRGLLQ